jgi:hypothetical protein
MRERPPNLPLLEERLLYLLARCLLNHSHQSISSSVVLNQKLLQVTALSESEEAKVSKAKNYQAFPVGKDFLAIQILGISTQLGMVTNKFKISMTSTTTFLKAYSKKCRVTPRYLRLLLCHLQL